ncbi:hypothetical protein EV182_000639 [Spiromyces aspiralis]|uniref:Uncharacterized protein n=1 Tax=Spiromyces aspiralis TaxID=68401 RepID=A0ACC1HKI0_9FUNG|nr:hypothetical protein EV182_000639 [Spiromyces aspiralis]
MSNSSDISVPQLMNELKLMIDHQDPKTLVVSVHCLLGQTSLSDISKLLVVMTLCWSPSDFLTLLQILVAQPPPNAVGARPFPTSYFGEEYYNTMVEQLKTLSLAELSTSEWIKNLGMALEAAVMQAGQQVEYARQAGPVAGIGHLAYGGMTKDTSQAMASLVAFIFQIIPCSSISMHQFFVSTRGEDAARPTSPRLLAEASDELHDAMVMLYDEWVQKLLQIIQQYPPNIYQSAPAVVKDPNSNYFTWGTMSLHSIVAAETLRNLLIRRIFLTNPDKQDGAGQAQGQESLRDELEVAILRSVISGDPSSVYGMMVACHRLLQMYYHVHRDRAVTPGRRIETGLMSRTLQSLEWAASGLAPILGFSEDEFSGAMSMNEVLNRLNSMKTTILEIHAPHLGSWPRDSASSLRYAELHLVQSVARVLDTQAPPENTFSTMLKSIVALCSPNPDLATVYARCLQAMALYADVFSVHTGLYMLGPLGADAGLTPSQKANLASPISNVWEAFAETLADTPCAFSNKPTCIWFEGILVCAPFISRTKCTSFKYQCQRFLDEWFYALVSVSSAENNEPLTRLLANLRGYGSQLSDLSLPATDKIHQQQQPPPPPQAQLSVSTVPFSVPGAIYTFFDRWPSLCGIGTEQAGLANIWKSNMLYFLPDAPSIAYAVCQLLSRDSGYLEVANPSVGRSEIGWLSRIESFLFDPPQTCWLPMSLALSTTEKDAKVKEAIALLKAAPLHVLLDWVGCQDASPAITLEAIRSHLELIRGWLQQVPYLCPRLHLALGSPPQSGRPAAHLSLNPLQAPTLLDLYQKTGDDEKDGTTQREIQAIARHWLDQSVILPYSLFESAIDQLLCANFPSPKKLLIEHVTTQYMCLDPVGGPDLIIRCISRNIENIKYNYNHRNSPFYAIRSLFMHDKLPATALRTVASSSSSLSSSALGAPSHLSQAAQDADSSTAALPPEPVYTSVVGGRVQRKEPSVTKAPQSVAKFPKTCCRILLSLTARLFEREDPASSPVYSWLTDLIQVAPFSALKDYANGLLFDQPVFGDPLYSACGNQWHKKAINILELWAKDQLVISVILSPVAGALFDHLAKAGSLQLAFAKLEECLESLPVFRSAIVNFFSNPAPDATCIDTLKSMARIPWDPAELTEFTLHPLMRILLMIEDSIDSGEIPSDTTKVVKRDWFLLYFGKILLEEPAAQVSGHADTSTTAIASSAARFAVALWRYLFANNMQQLNRLVPWCDAVSSEQGPILYTAGSAHQPIIPLSPLVRIFHMIEQQIPERQDLLLNVILPSSRNSPRCLFDWSVPDVSLSTFLQDLVYIYTICRSSHILSFVESQFKAILSTSPADSSEIASRWCLEVAKAIAGSLFLPNLMEPTGINASILTDRDNSSTDRLMPLFTGLLTAILTRYPAESTIDDSSFFDHYVQAIVNVIEDSMWDMASEVEASRNVLHRCPNPTITKSTTKFDAKPGDDPFLARVTGSTFGEPAVGSIVRKAGGGDGGEPGASIHSISDNGPYTHSSSASHTQVAIYRRSNVSASRAAAGLERSILLISQLFLQEDFIRSCGSDADDREGRGRLLNLFFAKLACSRLFLDTLMTAVGHKMCNFETVEPVRHLLRCLWKLSTTTRSSVPGTQDLSASDAMLPTPVKRIWSSLDFSPLAMQIDPNNAETRFFSWKDLVDTV